MRDGLKLEMGFTRKTSGITTSNPTLDGEGVIKNEVEAWRPIDSLPLPETSPGVVAVQCCRGESILSEHSGARGRFLRKRPHLEPNPAKLQFSISRDAATSLHYKPKELCP